MQSDKLRFEEDSLKFGFEEDQQPPAKIKVVGIGGAGRGVLSSRRRLRDPDHAGRGGKELHPPAPQPAHRGGAGRRPVADLPGAGAAGFRSTSSAESRRNQLLRKEYRRAC